MDIIYVIMLVFMTGSFCVISFLIGAGRNNKVNLNPVEAYKEHKEIKEQIKTNNLTQKQVAVMMENIDNYDGTATGQKDIPNE